jgi:hypothetical protein
MQEQDIAGGEAATQEQPEEGKHAARARGSRRKKPAAPDVFDEQIAQREQEQAAAQDQLRPANVEQVLEEARAQTNGDGQSRARVPDPFWFDSVALSDEKDGPRMYLGRSRARREMQMAFDEKPDDATLQALREAGFRWNGSHKVWTLHLERDVEWRGHADAERLFKNIANTIREKNGLEPLGRGMEASHG